MEASTTRTAGRWMRQGHATDAEFTEYAVARQDALLRFAYLISGDHHAAEDLVQTALARTYLAWGRLRDRGSLDAYVKRIIVNEHISQWRRASRRHEITTADVPDRSSPDNESLGDRRADRAVLWGLVQTLPPRQRAALVLRYFEDLSEADTAAVLACSVGSVKSQTSRALQTLRARVAEQPGILGEEA